VFYRFLAIVLVAIVICTLAEINASLRSIDAKLPVPTTPNASYFPNSDLHQFN